MTREEKLAVIRGTHEPESVFMGQAGWIRGVPRLGIPDLRFADGPPGVLVRRASTGMPATLAMAATFSRAEATANGAVIGRDARALGVDVILQPYINLYRDPTFERAYNTLGEDPVLTGTLAAQFVVAAQARRRDGAGQALRRLRRRRRHDRRWPDAARGLPRAVQGGGRCRCRLADVFLQPHQWRLFVRQTRKR